MVINPIVGVYIPIIRIPIQGGMTIPNIATFDYGTQAQHAELVKLLLKKRASPELSDSKVGLMTFKIHEILLKLR